MIIPGEIQVAPKGVREAHTLPKVCPVFTLHNFHKLFKAPHILRDSDLPKAWTGGRADSACSDTSTYQGPALGLGGGRQALLQPHSISYEKVPHTSIHLLGIAHSGDVHQASKERDSAWGVFTSGGIESHHRLAQQNGLLKQGSW